MLYKKLKEYSKSNAYPFHMPGHKRNCDELSDALPYDIDITEIYGFDNLHKANGCIDEVQKRAAALYDVKKTYLLVNGSTCGILASIRAMTSYGDKVIVARNCHKSVYNAIELCGLDAIYVTPEIDEELGIAKAITPFEIGEIIKKHKNIKLAILTSPTYEGFVSDINSISKICHQNGIKVFVDEAHGAHLPFSKYFPDEAVKSGADVAVVSLHKTLPSLTQTALLLCNEEDLVQPLTENLAVFQSSSPSYVLMSSIASCVDYLEDSKEKFEKYIKRLYSFSEKCEALKHLKILCSHPEIKVNLWFDISKIVIFLNTVSLNGVQLSDILRERYKIEIEMAQANYVVLMTSVCDTEDGFNRLFDALYEIDLQCKEVGNRESFACLQLPEKVFRSCEKSKYSGEFVDFKNAENKISLEYLWAYPPGIPLLVPGEKINRSIIDNIYKMKTSGVEVYSSKGQFECNTGKIYTVISD